MLDSHVAAALDDGAAPALETFESSEELGELLVEQAVDQWQHLFGEPALGPWYGRHSPVLDATVELNQAGDLGSVHVPGVAEADVVKADGSHLYIAQHDTLTIVDATDPDELKIASEIDLDRWANELYVTGDRLTVVSQDAYFYEPWLAADTGSIQLRTDAAFAPFPLPPFDPPQPRVTVTVFDISDPAEPTQVSHIEIDGYQVDSRAVGDSLYLVTQTHLSLPFPETNCEDDSSGEEGIDHEEDPVLDDDVSVVALTSAPPWWPDDRQNCTYETEEQYVTRVAPLAADLALPNATLFDADGNEVEDDQLHAAEDIYKPISDASNLISVSVIDVSAETPDVVDSSGTVANYATTVYASPENVYLVSPEWHERESSTILRQFAIGGEEPTVDLAAVGRVAGTPLNQFSIDEHDGFLRIATTSGWGDETENRLLVLQQNERSLDVVGELDELAPGERIFSARFLGDEAYVTTFRVVDPLFAIDLSDPTNPTTAGELKIPGFSNYLVPVDDGALLGLGRGDGGFGANPQLSLFDTSILSDPNRVDTFDLDKKGIYSSALWDHQAIGFYDADNILTLPVGYTVDEPKPWPDDWAGICQIGVPSPCNGEEWWDDNLLEGIAAAAGELVELVSTLHSDWLPKRVNELWVFQVDTTAEENHITLVGQIRHEAPVLRSARLDDVLFTISADTITAHPLRTPAETLDRLYFGPIATGDHFTVDVMDEATTLDVLANDRELHNDAKIVSLSETEYGGQVAISDDGRTVVYTPPDDLTIRHDRFEYTVTTAERTGTATVWVNLTRESLKEKMVGLAVDELSDRIGVPREKLDIQWVHERVWPDSCLGVPSDDGCADVVTPGFQVALAHNGHSFVYHTDLRETVILAETSISLTDDFFEVESDSSTVFDVLRNDRGGQDGAMIVEVGESELSAKIEIVEDGKRLRYTPGESGLNGGRDSFTYTVKSHLGVIATAHVVVEVIPSNRNGELPLPDHFSLYQNADRVILDVLANDFGDLQFIVAPTIEHVTQPSQGGKVEVVEDSRLLAYWPAEDFVGVETFNYSVLGHSATVTVLIVGSQTEDLIDVRLEVASAGGNAVKHARVGDDLMLNVYVDDLREDGDGVFATYIDIAYDSALADVNSEIIAGDSYPNGLSGDATRAGLIDEVGGFGGTVVLGGDERLLFTVPFVATEAGELSFSANLADLSPQHDSLLYGLNDAIPADAIRYGSITVRVTDGWHNAERPTDIDADGVTSPLDALVIINELNRGGARALSDDSSQPTTSSGEKRHLYLDANGDGYVTPLDVLYVINDINTGGGGEGEGEAGSVDLSTDVSDSPAALPGLGDLRSRTSASEARQQRVFRPSALIDHSWAIAGEHRSAIQDAISGIASDRDRPAQASPRDDLFASIASLDGDELFQ